MKIFGGNDPRTEIEFDCLGKFCNNSKAMNVEQGDGFFAAPHRGPTMADREAARRKSGGRLRVDVAVVTFRTCSSSIFHGCNAASVAEQFSAQPRHEVARFSGPRPRWTNFFLALACLALVLSESIVAGQPRDSHGG